jgi:hypothetical protein
MTHFSSLTVLAEAHQRELLAEAEQHRRGNLVPRQRRALSSRWSPRLHGWRHPFVARHASQAVSPCL